MDDDRAGSQNTTLRESAYERIRQQILSGVLPAGAAISEAERAEALGMSRSPVREALRQLAQDGLVEIFPKRGTFVTELSARDVREAFELREAIETACARLAAERRTDDDIEAMESACERIEASRDTDQAYESAARFHALVAAAARSQYLRLTFESSQAKIDLASRVAAATATAHRHREVDHRAILDAIVAGDGALSEDLMRRHLRESARSLIDRLM